MACNGLRWAGCCALRCRSAMNDQYTDYKTRICNVCAIASCRKYIHDPGICKPVNILPAICRRRARGTHACHTRATKLKHNKWVPPSISRTHTNANADALSKITIITNAQKLCDEACHLTILARPRNIMWLRISLLPDKIFQNPIHVSKQNCENQDKHKNSTVAAIGLR